RQRWQRVEQRRSGSDVNVELQNSVLLIAKPDLARRAQHAVGDRAADFSPLDREAREHLRAGLRKRVQLPSLHVRRAADYVEQLASARVDLRYGEVVTVRMSSALDDARNDERSQV